MKKLIVLILITAILLIGCGGSTETFYFVNKDNQTMSWKTTVPDGEVTEVKYIVGDNVSTPSKGETNYDRGEKMYSLMKEGKLQDEGDGWYIVDLDQLN